MTITLRSVKGLPLTNDELDDNFATLDTRGVQIAGDIGGSTSAPYVVALGGRSLSSSAPAVGQALIWSGSVWAPQAVSGAGGGSVSSTITSVVTSVATNTVSSTTTTYPLFGAYANNTDLQTFTSGTAQKVKFQVKEFDSLNCYTTSTSRFTPTVAGYYQINSEMRFDGIAGPNNELLVAIYKNGIEHKRGYNSTGVSPNAGTSTWFAMTVSSMVYANGTTDYFEIWAQHGNTGNLTITGVNQPNITYFNGFYIPYQVITAVTSTAAVTSTVTTTSNIAASNAVTVTDKINSQFNSLRQVFTLKVNRTEVIEGYSYKDNKDLLVTINGRVYDPYVNQITLGPWIVDMTAESAYTYKVKGSKLILFRAPRAGETANIRINTVSSARQTTSRYPFTANTIAFGD